MQTSCDQDSGEDLRQGNQRDGNAQAREAWRHGARTYLCGRAIRAIAAVALKDQDSGEELGRINPYSKHFKSVIEQHFSVKSVAAMLDMSPDWVRDTFAKMAGVKATGTRKSTRSGNGYKRKYTTLLIPESSIKRYLSQCEV